MTNENDAPQVKIEYYDFDSRLSATDRYNATSFSLRSSGRIEISMLHPDFKEQIRISFNLPEILQHTGTNDAIETAYEREMRRLRENIERKEDEK